MNVFGTQTRELVILFQESWRLAFNAHIYQPWEVEGDCEIGSFIQADASMK